MRGIVGGENQHRLRDMIGFADAASGVVAPMRFSNASRLRASPGLHPRSSTDRARRDHVDADVARRQFDAITRAIARTPACSPHRRNNRIAEHGDHDRSG